MVRMQEISIYLVSGSFRKDLNHPSCRKWRLFMPRSKRIGKPKDRTNVTWVIPQYQVVVVCFDSKISSCYALLSWCSWKSRFYEEPVLLVFSYVLLVVGSCGRFLTSMWQGEKSTWRDDVKHPQSFYVVKEQDERAHWRYQGYLSPAVKVEM